MTGADVVQSRPQSWFMFEELGKWLVLPFVVLSVSEVSEK